MYLWPFTAKGSDREGACLLTFSVGVFTVADIIKQNLFCVLINMINDTIIACADSIRMVGIFEFLTPDRSGVFGQRVYFFNNLRDTLPMDSLKIILNGSPLGNLIKGHLFLILSLIRPSP